MAKVSAYSAQQAAAIAGVAQTIKALNFMMLAETRDTLGIPLYAVGRNPTDPPYCNKDVWAVHRRAARLGLHRSQYGRPDPAAGRSRRVLRRWDSRPPEHRAGLVRGIQPRARGQSGARVRVRHRPQRRRGRTDSDEPWHPRRAALTRADSALTASALYNPSAIAPPVAGNFALDPFGVYHTFSGQSGDLQNAILRHPFSSTTRCSISSSTSTRCTTSGGRTNSSRIRSPVQLVPVRWRLGRQEFLPYATVGSPIPIVRAEELALVRAQIQLGLGNFANAIALINQVHMQAGGFAAPLRSLHVHGCARHPAQGAADLDGVRSQRRSHDRASHVRPGGRGRHDVASESWPRCDGRRRSWRCRRISHDSGSDPHPGALLARRTVESDLP